MASHEGSSILSHPDLDAMVTSVPVVFTLPHLHVTRTGSDQITRLKKRQGLTEKEVTQLCTRAKEVLSEEQVSLPNPSTHIY